jgi:hypothetical protein
LLHPFAPRHVFGPQWLCAIRLPSAREPVVCACSHVCAKSRRPVPRIRAWSPLPVLPAHALPHPSAPFPKRSRPTHLHPNEWAQVPTPTAVQRVHARSYTSTPCFTCSRPFSRVRTQRVRTLTSKCTRPQLFPAGTSPSRVRPQAYKNPFAALH